MRWALLPLVAGVGPWAACASSPADDRADDALRSDDAVTVELDGPLTAFLPSDPATSRAVAFYPGGLVDPDAYAPLLRRLAEAGVPSVLVAMPGDLAVLAPNRGDRAIDAYPDLGPWIAAGHSLGGAMACTWADARRDALAGLALLAAYPAADKDLTDVGFPVLSITASDDGVLDWDTFDERRANLPAETAWRTIDGGNHAGFGAYGPQDGDGEATIPTEQQWDAVVSWLAPLAVEGAVPD